MNKRWEEKGLPLGLTLILIGYFLPWLSHPTNGLTLIGLDISEWIKFLPQIGELPNRNLFYLPPITLGLILVLLSVRLAQGWRPWALRAVGILVATISFPSIDALRFEAAGEWRLRLFMIAFVVAVAMGSVWLGRLPKRITYGLITLTAMVGLILPTYLFSIILPVVETWLVIDWQVGLGIWFNGIGHLLIGGIALSHARNGV